MDQFPRLNHWLIATVHCDAFKLVVLLDDVATWYRRIVKLSYSFVCGGLVGCEGAGGEGAGKGNDN